MEGVIGPNFAQALAADRDRFNARFAQARRTWPRLDAASFLNFLRRRIDPVVAAIAEHNAAHAPQAVEAFYEMSLELIGKGLAGPNARDVEFEPLWAELMTRTAAALAWSPRELIAPLTNALYNLTQTPGCRAAEWCRLVGSVAANSADVGQIRAAGQVAGWLCGMAQYRDSALELARTMPANLAAALLLAPGSSTELLPSVLERLSADPWFRPDRDRSREELRIVAEVGGFRGFGGVLLRPPLVASEGDSLYVSDGTSCWLLLADAFGAVFHRVPDELPKNRSNGRYVLHRDGTAAGPHSQTHFPLLAGASSSAAIESTLAVTLPISHKVFLLSEGG